MQDSLVTSVNGLAVLLGIALGRTWVGRLVSAVVGPTHHISMVDQILALLKDSVTKVYYVLHIAIELIFHMRWIGLHWVHSFLLSSTWVEAIDDFVRLAWIELAHWGVCSGHGCHIDWIYRLILSLDIHNLSCSFRHGSFDLTSSHLR